MLGAIVGIVGGAAASTLGNRVGRRGNLRRLKEREQQLALEVAELQDSLKLSHSEPAQLERIQEMMGKLDEAQAEKDRLMAEAQREREEMSEQLEQSRAEVAKANETLLLQGQEFSAKQEQLESKHQQAQSEAQKEIEDLRASHATEMAAYQEQLDQLRAKVSDTMSKLLARDISDKEAATVMESLGCTVTYIEAPPSTNDTEASEEEKRRAAEWEQPQLLLNDRARLERLVTASRCVPGLTAAPTATSESSMRRLPVVMFPQFKTSSFKAPEALCSGKDQTTLKITSSPADDVQTQPDSASSKKGADQTRDKPAAPKSITAAKPGKKGADQSDSKQQGVKFTYSLQGAKGNQWIAKMPASTGSDQQAGLAYLSSDNSPKLRGAPAFPSAVDSLTAGGFEDDLGFSSSRELTIGRF